MKMELYTVGAHYFGIRRDNQGFRCAGAATARARPRGLAPSPRALASRPRLAPVRHRVPAHELPCARVTSRTPACPCTIAPHSHRSSARLRALALSRPRAFAPSRLRANTSTRHHWRVAFQCVAGALLVPALCAPCAPCASCAPAHLRAPAWRACVARPHVRAPSCACMHPRALARPRACDSHSSLSVVGMKRARDDAPAALVAPPPPPPTTASFSDTSKLVERLNWGGTNEMKEAAAFAVRKLAWNTDNHKSVVCTIPHLVSLLCSGADRVKEAAADAIYPLARNKDLHAALSDAVFPLVLMLCQGSSDRAKESAIDALGYLIADDDVKRIITETGAINSLVALLRKSGTAGVKAAAAVALGLLSCNCRTSQIEIAEAGAIDPLVALLYADGFQPLAAVEALRNLAYKNHKNAMTVGSHRGVIALLVAMQRGGVDDDTKDAANTLLHILGSAGFMAAMQR